MFTVVVNEDIGYWPDSGRTKEIVCYSGTTESSLTVCACEEIYHDTQLYYRIYNGVTDGQHRLKSIEIIDGNGNNLKLESIDSGGTKMTKNGVIINTNNATGTTGETTTTTTVPVPVLNITRNYPSSADTIQQYDIYQSGLSYQDFYPVVVNTISAITGGSSEGGGYKASGITIPSTYLNFENEESKRNRFLFRVTDWGGNVIEEVISDMFYGENKPYCSSDLAQYASYDNVFYETVTIKTTKGEAQANVGEYKDTLRYLPYYNIRFQNEWVGRATYNGKSAFNRDTYVPANTGYRQDGKGLDYEEPSLFTPKRKFIDYPFVQFYDTFNDYEDGDEKGDVSVDTVYKQWTIDTNRISFVKDFIEIDNNHGWWNAFGAQLYYSTLKNEEEN